MKDANDLLVASLTNPAYLKKITQAVYEARDWRPGGIVNGTSLWDAMMASSTPGRTYPYECLNSMRTGLGGAFPGQLITWVSGTGMGKSTLVREIGYHDLMHHADTVADVRLEEGVGQTGLGYLGLHLNKRLMLDAARADPGALKTAFDQTINNGRFWTYDHFGSLDDGDLVGKLRYLAKGCGARTIILDHISIVVSGMDADGDERRTLDRLMTSLRSLVENTGVTLHAVCHLRRVSNGTRSAEDGGKISLSDLRGSQSIAQLSDAVIGLERNQQDDDPSTRNTAAVRILKCRKTGYTGIAGYLKYDPETGRMIEAEAPQKEDQSARRGSSRDDGDVPF